MLKAALRAAWAAYKARPWAMMADAAIIAAIMAVVVAR